MFARKATPCLLDLNLVPFLYLLFFLFPFLSLPLYLSLSICRNLDIKFEADQNCQNDKMVQVLNRKPFGGAASASQLWHGIEQLSLQSNTTKPGNYKAHHWWAEGLNSNCLLRQALQGIFCHLTSLFLNAIQGRLGNSKSGQPRAMASAAACCEYLAA